MQKVKDFWQKHKTPILVGGGAVTAYIGYKVIKDKIDFAKLLKQIRDFRKGNSGIINYKQAAYQLGLDIGFEYGWWNPQRWTENDDKVIELINTMGKDHIMKVSMEYANLYGRDLQKDAQKYLGSDYDKVSRVFTGQSGAIQKAIEAVIKAKALDKAKKKSKRRK